MQEAFLYKLVLSFVVGGAWITLVTVAAEKYGSRLGGLIGGLPSTAAVALLFIGITQSPAAASEAAAVLPLAMVASGFFALVFLASIKRRFIYAYMVALATWFALASAMLLVGALPYLVSLAIWLGVTLFLYLIVEKKMRISSKSSIKVEYTPIVLFLRALFSGSVVAFAVLMGKLGGPRFGGIFAAFPAVYTSTFYISYRTGGVEFSKAVAKSIVISAMINVTVFAIAIKYLYPATGLSIGTLGAFAISVISGFCTHKWITSRLS